MSKKVPFSAPLFCLFLSVTVCSAPFFKTFIGFPGKNLVNSNNTHQQKCLGKVSAVTALKWQQIGASHYTSSGNQGNPEPWEFLSRDTSVFDNSGKLVVSKSTDAHSGWNTDSLTILDSSVYKDGKLVEMIYRYSDPLGSDDVDDYRFVMEYLNGGKTVVATAYDFDSLNNTWVLSSKDSIIFKNAITNMKTESSFNFEEYQSFLFDATDSKWKSAGHIAKITSECNANTLTFGGTVLEEDTSETFVDIKYIYSFKTPELTLENISGMVSQTKNKLTGIYNDDNRLTFSFDANGNKTTRNIEIDPVSAKVLSDFKDLEFPDSHGLDTLQIYMRFDTVTLSWDTMSTIHNNRSYDNNGNNSETVESIYNSFDNKWYITGKIVNLFTQIDVPVIRLIRVDKKQSISVSSKGTIVKVMAPELTGLMIYNANGRLITALRQPAASSISIDLSASKVYPATGVYMAKAICKNGQYTMKLSINR